MTRIVNLFYFFYFILVHLTERIGKSTAPKLEKAQHKRGVNCLRVHQKCMTSYGSIEFNWKQTKSWMMQPLKTRTDRNV